MLLSHVFSWLVPPVWVERRLRRADAGAPPLPGVVDSHCHLQSLPAEELMGAAKELRAPYELVREAADTGRLPVVLFCAGGVATPADAALVMQLGAEGVFVGSGIFKSDNPAARAKAVVEATTHFRDPHILAKVSRGLGGAMPGLEVDQLGVRLADRGW